MQKASGIGHKKEEIVDIGRNDRCHCKSDKKFKHCCLPYIKDRESLSHEKAYALLDKANKYMPHQSDKECRRRRRQLELGEYYYD